MNKVITPESQGTGSPASIKRGLTSGIDVQHLLPQRLTALFLDFLLELWYLWDAAYWRDCQGDAQQTDVWNDPLMIP